MATAQQVLTNATTLTGDAEYRNLCAVYGAMVIQREQLTTMMTETRARIDDYRSTATTPQAQATGATTSRAATKRKSPARRRRATAEAIPQTPPPRKRGRPSRAQLEAEAAQAPN